MIDCILISHCGKSNDIDFSLSLPIHRALLRKLGAFYIKRKIDPVAGKKDIVYRAVLHTYMQHALRAQHNVEFFIEGGRTRTGKPCMPKSGVLSGMLLINTFVILNCA